MDPEAGASPIVGQHGSPGSDQNQSGALATILHALWERLQAVLGALAPKQKAVGVENRFYFDETEKVWKLRGGETEQERAESEALRFHTSRGLTNAMAPPTTACDASRADWSASALPPPPPPTSGPVTSSIHGGSGGVGLEAYSHPVYAPAASFAGGASGASGSRAPPPPRVAPAPPQALTTPFGGTLAPSTTPLSSPFGVLPQQQQQQQQPQQTPLASPFGYQPQEQPQQPQQPAPLSAPFGQPPAGAPGGAPAPPGPLAAPFGAGGPAEASAMPGQGAPAPVAGAPNPLAAPFGATATPLAAPFGS